MTHKDLENLNRLFKGKQIEMIYEGLPQKIPDPESFTDDLYPELDVISLLFDLPPSFSWKMPDMLPSQALCTHSMPA